MFERLPKLLVQFSLSSVLIACGCSSDQGPKFYPVSGKVLVDGKPAEYATVSLTPVDSTDGRLPAGGIANADGEFRLRTLKEADGAESGEYYVAISWTKPINLKTSEPEYGPELLPAKYQDPVKWAKKVVIEESDNELPVFEIAR